MVLNLCVSFPRNKRRFCCWSWWWWEASLKIAFTAINRKVCHLSSHLQHNPFAVSAFKSSDSSSSNASLWHGFTPNWRAIISGIKTSNNRSRPHKLNQSYGRRVIRRIRLLQRELWGETPQFCIRSAGSDHSIRGHRWISNRSQTQ